MPIKYTVEITPSAERDAEEIWTYTADDSPEDATAFIRAVGGSDRGI
jgi:plasmid stabilization system protein ParE